MSQIVRLTCNACRKLGQFERTCSGHGRETNQWRGRGREGLARDEIENHQSTHSVDNASKGQVAWVNQQGCGESGSVSSGSDDYMLMSIKKKNLIELKTPGSRVRFEVSGKKILLCVDSGSPVTIFSMTDLKASLSKTNFHLQPSEEEFLDCNNNRIHMLSKVAVTMALNGWAAPAQVSVIAGNHQSSLRRDLPGSLGLELVQRGKFIRITGEGNSQDAEGNNELQTYFCKLYPNLFTRIGKTQNAKVRAEFFEKKTVQQKRTSGANQSTEQSEQGNISVDKRRTH